MHTTPTLSAHEFTVIHNALCQLDSVEDRLAGTLDRQIVAKLRGAIDQIRAALHRAYIDEDARWERMNDHYKTVGETMDVSSCWSMTEVDDLLQPHGLGDVDRVIYRGHWGPNPVSASVRGNTWAALWRAADECIRTSGDDHHCFIEGLRHSAEDPRTLVLSTGS